MTLIMGNHGPLNGYEIMIIKKDESPSHNYYLSFTHRFIQDEKINRSFSFKAIYISKGELFNEAVMNTISLFFKETFPFWIFKKNEMENLSYEINTYVCILFAWWCVMLRAEVKFNSLLLQWLGCVFYFFKPIIFLLADDFMQIKCRKFIVFRVPT